jgi:hypothetical protein
MSSVTVSTNWPVTQWDTQVAGVPTIYISGTTFDSSLLAPVQSAATALGVALSVNTSAPFAPGETLTKAQADTLYEPVGAATSGGGPIPSDGIVDGGNAATSFSSAFLDGGSA